MSRVFLAVESAPTRYWSPLVPHQRRSLPAWIVGLSLLLGSPAASLPAQGARAAIERSTRDWLAAVKVDSIGLTRTDLRILGDVAIEIGTVRTASTPRGGTTSTVDHADYLTVWHRQRDGGWKIVRDMTSPLPRPAAAAR
jgi:ketosteroid isomerase-like protein